MRVVGLFLAGVGLASAACSDGTVSSTASGNWYGSSVWDATPDATKSLTIANDIVITVGDAQVQMIEIASGASLEVLSNIAIEDVDCSPECVADTPCLTNGNCVYGTTCSCRGDFTDTSGPIELNDQGSYGDCQAIADGATGGACVGGACDAGAGACSSDSLCVKCPANQGVDSSTAACSPPPDGKYVDDTGKFQDCDSSCSTCSGPAATECTACIPSAELSGGKCACPSGTYGNAVDGCTMCAAGKFAAGGTVATADDCSPCAANSYKVADAETCTSCPEDTDTCGGDGSACLTGQTASSDCVSCATIDSVPYTAASGASCSGCPPGEYDDNGSCVACTAIEGCHEDAITFSVLCTTASDSYCQRCDTEAFKGCSGTVNGDAGCDAACEVCAEGTGIGPDDTVCSEPADNFYATAEGGFAACDASCLGCSGPSATECTRCHDPSVSLVDGVCACVAGEFGDSSGCTACDAGFTSALGAAATEDCTACPANTYNDETMLTCESCPENTDTCGGNGAECATGSSTVSDCVTCGRFDGVQFSSLSGSPCSGCADGTYDNGVGACADCTVIEGCDSVTCNTAEDAICVRCGDGYFCAEGAAPVQCAAIENCDAVDCEDASGSTCTTCGEAYRCIDESCSGCVEPVPYTFELSVDLTSGHTIEAPADISAWDGVCAAVDPDATATLADVGDDSLVITCTVELVGTEEEVEALISTKDAEFVDASFLEALVETAFPAAIAVISGGDAEIEAAIGAPSVRATYNLVEGGDNGGSSGGDIEAYSSAPLGSSISLAALFMSAVAAMFC